MKFIIDGASGRHFAISKKLGGKSDFFSCFVKSLRLAGGELHGIFDRLKRKERSEHSQQYKFFHFLTPSYLGVISKNTSAVNILHFAKIYNRSIKFFNRSTFLQKIGEFFNKFQKNPP
jgi:hypothetical protein